MHTTLVHVWVVPDQVRAFRTATLQNRAGTIREPGNLRFDILEDANDPTKFILFEVFVDDAAAKAHKATEHYAQWRGAVAPWMARAREAHRVHIVAPLDPSIWKDDSATR